MAKKNDHQAISAPPAPVNGQRGELPPMALAESSPSAYFVRSLAVADGYLLMLERQEGGGYSVRCSELPEVQAQGRTFEEAMSNIDEALDLYLDAIDLAEAEHVSATTDPSTWHSLDELRQIIAARKPKA